MYLQAIFGGHVDPSSLSQSRNAIYAKMFVSNCGLRVMAKVKGLTNPFWKFDGFKWDKSLQYFGDFYSKIFERFK